MIGRGGGLDVEDLLPLEMWYHTLGFLSRAQLLRAREVCRDFKGLVDKPLLKQTLPSYRHEPSSKLQFKLADFWSWEVGSEKCIAILTKGDIAFCTTKEGVSEIAILDITTGQCKSILSVPSHEEEANFPFVEIKALPENKLATLNTQGQIFIWDVKEKNYTKIPELFPYQNNLALPQLLVAEDGDILIPKLNMISVFNHSGQFKKEITVTNEFDLKQYLRLLPDGRLARCWNKGTARRVLDLETGEISEPCRLDQSTSTLKLPTGELLRATDAAGVITVHTANNIGTPSMYFVSDQNERIIAMKVTDNYNLICFTRDSVDSRCYYARILTFPRCHQFLDKKADDSAKGATLPEQNCEQRKASSRSDFGI